MIYHLLMLLSLTCCSTALDSPQHFLRHPDSQNQRELGIKDLFGAILGSPDNAESEKNLISSLTDASTQITTLLTEVNELQSNIADLRASDAALLEILSATLKGSKNLFDGMKSVPESELETIQADGLLDGTINSFKTGVNEGLTAALNDAIGTAANAVIRNTLTGLLSPLEPILGERLDTTINNLFPADPVPLEEISLQGVIQKIIGKTASNETPAVNAVLESTSDDMVVADNKIQDWVQSRDANGTVTSTGKQIVS